MFDVITIGSATMDAFIESKDAKVVHVCSLDTDMELMAFPYGSKLEIKDFIRRIGGGGVNTAVNFANLGFNTSSIIKIGDKDITHSFTEVFDTYNIDRSNISMSEEYGSGFSIILVSFQGDRTVLAHRGANAHIEEKDVNFDAIKSSKWLYVAPLAGDSNKILDKLAKFTEKNKVNLAVNAGTTAIKQGEKYFSKIVKVAKVVVLNKEEAQMLTKINVRPDTKEIFYSKEAIHPDIETMLIKLRMGSQALVVITDGKNGAYAFDGVRIYICPPFKSKVCSTLGAGDAFSSTLVGALEKTNWDIETSLKMASVNSAAVVEVFGAQEGLIKFEEIEKRLNKAQDYNVKIIGVSKF